MGFLDKAKAAAGQAVAKTKEVGDDLQLKRDLGQAYDELGKAAFALIESGELSHEKLEEPAARIRELNEKAAGAETDGEPAEPEPEAAETIEPAEPSA
jgi:hypothetical protein